MVRRDVDNDGRIPVGVRGLRRDQRAAGWVKPGNVLRVVSPEELCVTADLLRSPFVTQPPVQVALQLAQQPWPWRWGITGSTGYALATGIPVIHADSDLDLLIRARSRYHPTRLPRQSQLSGALCRADTVDTPEGRIRAGGVAARWQNAAENPPWATHGGRPMAQGGSDENTVYLSGAGYAA